MVTASRWNQIWSWILKSKFLACHIRGMRYVFPYFIPLSPKSRCHQSNAVLRSCDRTANKAFWKYSLYIAIEPLGTKMNKQSTFLFSHFRDSHGEVWVSSFVRQQSGELEACTIKTIPSLH